MTERKVKIDAQIEKALREDLKQIAAEDFDGNFSMVVRLACREFRDRRRAKSEQ